jgi:hypothetical protein
MRRQYSLQDRRTGSLLNSVLNYVQDSQMNHRGVETEFEPRLTGVTEQKRNCPTIERSDSFSILYFPIKGTVNDHGSGGRI